MRADKLSDGGVNLIHYRESKMPHIIEKIVTILNGYGYGKLLALKKKNRFGHRVRDVVSISEEARRRYSAGEDGAASPHVDETYGK